MSMLVRELRNLLGIVACRRGASAVEFALAAPLVILLTVGTVETGLLIFTNSLLEGSVRDTSRLGITGYAPQGVSRVDMLRQTLESRTLGLIDVDRAVITHKVYQSFADIGKPEPFTDNNPANGDYDLGEPFVDSNGNGVWDSDMGAAGLGGSSSIVVYTVSYDWTSPTHLLDPLLGPDKKVTLTASTAVRNEPF